MESPLTRQPMLGGVPQPCLSITLLGPPGIACGGEELGPALRYRKSWALLGYLAVHAGRPLRREHLADLLWPRLDAPTARTNLRQVLTPLAAALDLAGCLQRNRDSLALLPGGSLRCDLDVLSDATLTRAAENTAASRHWRVHELEPRATTLGGEFLQGLDLADTPEFDSWASACRAHFRRRTVLVLAHLRDAQRDDGRLADAIATARRLVGIDRLDEAHATALATLLSQAGDREGALEALDALADALRTELAAAPGATALDLRERLARLPARPAAAGPELRWITAMYCDAGLRHDDPRSEDGSFAEALRGAVALRGGTLVAAAGSGFLAVFGLDDCTERSAKRALLSALDILGALGGALGGAFALRIGIGAGRALCRIDAGVPHLAGELPDRVMRIAWTAEPGEVLVDEDVARQTAARFEHQPLGERAFRGIDGAHRLFRLRSRAPSAPPPLEPDAPAFVGREAELATLRGLWDAVCQRSMRLAVVRGGPGLGKTRLVRELASAVAAGGGQVQRIVGRLETQHRALAPFLDGLAVAAETADRGDASGRLHDGVAAGKEAAFAAIAALLELRIASAPTLVLVDDLHWCDHASIELVGALVRWLRERPVLFVVTTRPLPAHELPLADATLIELGPLSPHDCATLVGTSAAAGTIPAPEQHRIAAASGGVPLFAQRLAKGWVEGRHHLLPIHELLQSELDALGAHKAVLRAASVLGERFRVDDLRRLAPQLDIAAGLARAGAHGLVVAALDKATFAFRHALVRDAAYESLPFGRRKSLHLAAARSLQAQEDAAPEDVAHHLGRAGAPAEAATWWMRAARAAIGAGYAGDAMNHCRFALDALEQAGSGPQDDAVLQARLQLGVAAQMAQGYGSALAYREFGEIAARIDPADTAPGRHEALFAALSGMFMGSSSQGAVEGVGTARRLHELARAPDEALAASFALGNALFWAGSFEEALAWQRGGIARADALAPADRLRYCVDDPAVTCRAFASWSLWFRGDAEAAVAMAADAVALARQVRRAHTLCFALVFATGVHWFREEPARVAALAGECLEIARRHAFPMWEGASGLFLAWAEAVSGGPCDPSTLTGAATQLAASYQAGITTSRWIAARGLRALGARREAEELLEVSVREAHMHEDQYCLADLLWMQGECLQRRMQPREAARLFARARRLARSQGAAGLLGRFRAARSDGAPR